ncbi:MAG: phage minor head protein [Betaproteobacteria bacterium]|nr:phage minor head protein [Betaproteobacteria bacterium]
MAAPNLAFAFGLSPEAAVRYFRSKDIYVPPDWQPIRDDVHRRSFTAARISCMDVATALHSEVDRAVNEGITLAEFKRTLTPTLQRLGWWGRGEFIDGDGVIHTGMLGSPRRLEIIYGENTRRAYAAGRRQQMLENKANRPYWQWIHGASKIPRPSHIALDRRVFRWDDPIWSKIHPCREFGCKCSARALSQADLDAEGLTVESSKNYISEIDDVDAFGNPIKRHAVKMPGMQTAMPLDIVPVEQSAQSELTALALEKAAVAPPVLAAGVIKSIFREHAELLAAYSDDFSVWAEIVRLEGNAKINALFALGVVQEEAIRNFEIAKMQKGFEHLRNVEIGSPVIFIDDNGIWHAIRPEEGRTPLPWQRFLMLPEIIQNPRVMILDATRNYPALVYLVESPSGYEKVIVNIDYSFKRKFDPTGKKRRRTGNFFMTSYITERENEISDLMNESKYPVLFGSWR